MPVGMTANTKNATVYVSPNFVVKNYGFTKHYYAGAERIMSKIGIGEFNNHFSPTNQVITAGNKNYIQRQSQLSQGLTDYYLQLQIPPGNPTQPNLLGQPEQTGQPLPTVTGDYTIPRGWPQQPYFNPPGGPPGPPAQWGEPITNDNVTAGYGYVTNGLEERDLYFYHPDHLGSTSIITDRNGIATQFIAYLPFGESFVDEHTSTWESPYKFSGKELDSETGLYYYGARYYDPKTSLWYGVDPLAGKYPGVGGYVFCSNNPVNRIDPDGRADFWHNGRVIGNDGVDDKRILAIKTTEKSFGSKENNSFVEGAGLSKKDLNATVKFITANSGNAEAFQNNGMAYTNSIAIENSADNRQAMVNEVSKDNGRGGMSDANNREYGGSISNGTVTLEAAGSISSPGNSASIALPVGVSTFHSHPSGSSSESSAPASGTGSTVSFGGTVTNRGYVQSPSPQDINNAGRHTNYVFGRGNNNVYIWALLKIQHFDNQ
jgi:RHS repeat-associated protein